MNMFYGSPTSDMNASKRGQLLPSCGPAHERMFFGYAFLAASLILTGCHRGPPVVYVEGVVTMNGEPIEAAHVGFTPAGTLGSMPAAGFTDAKGKFVLSAHTAKFGAGTTVGEYIVIVSKTIIPPGEEDKESPKVVLVTPVVYQVKETSPLRATVVKGRNRFEFDLEPETSGKKSK